MTAPVWAVDLPKRIAFAGEMGAGKSASASVLQDIGYFRLAFADVLRECLSPIYGLIDKRETYFVHQGDGTETGPVLTGRELLQQMGTAMRAVDSNIFMRAIARRVYEMGNVQMVIDDVRFPAEARFLEEHGFKVFKLVCPSPIRRERVGKSWIGNGDISEMAVSQIVAPELNTAAMLPMQVVQEIAARSR